MQARGRNDVKPSVGQVVTSHQFEWVEVSSISVDVLTCVNLGFYKPLIGDTEKALIFLKNNRI
jgi:hypothetical protein